MEVTVLPSPPGQVLPIARASRRKGSEAGDPWSRAAIGTFDGVHLGHQSVIRGCDTVITFDQPPMNVLSRGRAKGLITDLWTRLRRIEQLGVQRAVVIEFNAAWSLVSAEAFARIVREYLGCRQVRVGANFRFGHGGRGTAATLADHGAIAVDSVGLREHGCSAISSTRIRDLVGAGAVVEASSLMGAPLTLPYQRVDARTVLISAQYVVPPAGVYIASVHRKPVAVTVGDDNRLELSAAFDCGPHNYIAFGKEL